MGAIKKSVFTKVCMILLIFTTFNKLYAQQEAQFTQFIHNTQSYNPAYVGFNGEKSLTALYRAQWIGVEGAPKTQLINYSAPSRWRGLSMGFGLVNDKIGPTTETVVNLDVSYTISLNASSQIAFGIKAGAHILDINYNLLNQDFSLGPDPILNNAIDNRFAPNVGAGVFYYTPNFYIGFSVPTFLETLYFDQSSFLEAKDKMHFYLNSGFALALSNGLILRPSFLVKTVTGAPLQTDLSAAVLLKERVSFGLSYRLKAAVSGLVGYQFSEEFFIGISYDRAATDLGQEIFNSGSLEVVLKYQFRKNVARSNFSF
jgi:type IX secretion system PorP/SprF family membrane protein